MLAEHKSPIKYETVHRDYHWVATVGHGPLFRSGSVVRFVQNQRVVGGGVVLDQGKGTRQQTLNHLR